MRLIHIGASRQMQRFISDSRLFDGKCRQAGSSASLQARPRELSQLVIAAFSEESSSPPLSFSSPSLETWCRHLHRILRYRCLHHVSNDGGEGGEGGEGEGGEGGVPSAPEKLR